MEPFFFTTEGVGRRWRACHAKTLAGAMRIATRRRMFQGTPVLVGARDGEEISTVAENNDGPGGWLVFTRTAHRLGCC